MERMQLYDTVGRHTALTWLGEERQDHESGDLGHGHGLLPEGECEGGKGGESGAEGGEAEVRYGACDMPGRNWQEPPSIIRKSKVPLKRLHSSAHAVTA